MPLHVPTLLLAASCWYIFRNTHAPLNMFQPDILTKRFQMAAEVQRVEKEDLNQDDIIIAVMGPTGSGKSTFIKMVTGADVQIGHDLTSCTANINAIKICFPAWSDNNIVFVDTPGFDDTNKSDIEILKLIADWLKSTYGNNIQLSGLLYFHRISDNRMGGTALKNLHMFESLCGKNSFSNIILTTSMWGEVDLKVGEEREDDLKKTYWKTMIGRGSTIERFLYTPESAFQLLKPLIITSNMKCVTLLQKEMVKLHRQLNATSAGQKLVSEMENVLNSQRDLLLQLERELKEGKKFNDPSVEYILKEYQRVRSSRDVVLSNLRQMRLPFFAQMKNKLTLLNLMKHFGVRSS